MSDQLSFDEIDDSVRLHFRQIQFFFIDTSHKLQTDSLFALEMW